MSRQQPLMRYGRGGGPMGGGPPRASSIKVDREKTCPFLVRTFVKTGIHHRDEDFSPERLPNQDEHQIYTWRDSTLREIILLLRDASPILRSHANARYSIRLIYWNNDRSIFLSKEIGQIPAREVVNPHSNYRLGEKTLDTIDFVVGDFLSVAYLPPMPGGGPGQVLQNSIGIRGVSAPHGPGIGGPTGSTQLNGGGGLSRAEQAWGKSLGGVPERRGPLNPGLRRDVSGGAGGPGSRGIPPADQGWGARRTSGAGGPPAGAPTGPRDRGTQFRREDRDAPPHQQQQQQRRRSSRSLSPAPRRGGGRSRSRDRSRSRSRSPARRNNDDDMRE